MSFSIYKCFHARKCYPIIVKISHWGHGLKMCQPTWERYHWPINGFGIKLSRRTRCFKRLKCLLTVHFIMQEFDKMFQKVTQTNFVIFIRISWKLLGWQQHNKTKSYWEHDVNNFDSSQNLWLTWTTFIKSNELVTSPLSKPTVFDVGKIDKKLQWISWSYNITK